MEESLNSDHVPEESDTPLAVKPLGIIPAYLAKDGDLQLLHTAIRTFWETVGDRAELLVVDDASPREDLVDEVKTWARLDGWGLAVKDENTGFAQTVNVGLKQALAEGRDAILINADIEFHDPGWLDALMDTRYHDDSDGQIKDAAVAGALLIYPNGLVQHAGIFFSLLHRWFDHFHKYAPQNLPEANEYKVCPVTGALQLIRHETLQAVGLYDERFRMGWEDVDYCIRVFLSGRMCIYNPNVRAFHHEGVFRGQPSPKLLNWRNESWFYLMQKYADRSFAGLVPFQ